MPKLLLLVVLLSGTLACGPSERGAPGAPPPATPAAPGAPAPLATSPSSPAPPPPASPAQLNQGVRGRVEKKIGNFMPRSVDTPPHKDSTGDSAARKKPGVGSTSPTVTPLSVPVHVFRGAIPVTPTFDPKHPALVATVTSDANGAYRVPLAPGTYTVVAEINGKLYLNSFRTSDDGRYVWSTVDVTADTWTDLDIDETSDATF